MKVVEEKHTQSPGLNLKETEKRVCIACMGFKLKAIFVLLKDMGFLVSYL